MFGFLLSLLSSTGVLIFLVGSLAILVAQLVAMLCAGAIIFSRIAFSLAAAFIAAQCGMTLVPNNNLLNYIAWVFVLMGSMYFLATLPRVDMALKFLCTVLLSVVILEIVIIVLGSVIAAFSNAEFALSMVLEIVVKVICTIFSFVFMFIGKKPHYDSPDTPILLNLERGLASLMYGIAIAFLFIPLGEGWELSVLLVLLVLIVSAVAAFIADIYLVGKDILGLEQDNEIHMPR